MSVAKVTKPRVSCCAAKIINYVQDVQEWQDSQTIDLDDYDNEYFYEDYDDGWVRRTYTQIREGLKREHSLHVIREAMELLIRLGFLERRKNLMAENGRNGKSALINTVFALTALRQLLRRCEKDDINRIAVMVAGAILLEWGFALAPLPFQLLIEIAILVPVSSICLRCLGCGSTR
jgi:hypothetical protein